MHFYSEKKMEKMPEKEKKIAKPHIQTAETLQILLQFTAIGIRNATEFPPAILLLTNLGSSKEIARKQWLPD